MQETTSWQEKHKEEINILFEFCLSNPKKSINNTQATDMKKYTIM